MSSQRRVKGSIFYMEAMYVEICVRAQVCERLSLCLSICVFVHRRVVYLRPHQLTVLTYGISISLKKIVLDLIYCTTLFFKKIP